MSENDTDELCALLADVKLKAETNSIDTASAVGKVFSDSFVNCANLTHEEMKEMAKTWVTIEDDPDVIDAVIDSEIEALEKMTEMQNTSVESESEEENDDLDDDVKMEHIVTNDEMSGALDCLKLFIEQNELPDECSRDINRVERSIYRHKLTNMTSRKTSTPSINSFFKK